MNDWNGVLTRQNAIRLIDRVTDRDDPFWEYLVEDFYNEDDDTVPSIYNVLDALGVTEDEYIRATGVNNVKWPE